MGFFFHLKVRLKRKDVFTDFGACRKNVFYDTLTPLLGVEMRSKQKKWNSYYQTEFDGEPENNNHFMPRELLRTFNNFFTKT